MRACRWRAARCGGAQRLETAIEQQQLGGERGVGDVGRFGGADDAAQMQQRAGFLGGVVDADRERRAQLGDQQGLARAQLEAIRRDMDFPAVHALLYTFPVHAREPSCPNYELPHAARVEYRECVPAVLTTCNDCSPHCSRVRCQPRCWRTHRCRRSASAADAQVTAKPDRVQVDLGVSTRAATSQEAAAQNARTLDAVLAAVRKAAGPAAVLKTVSYTLNPNYQYHPNGGEPTLEGYTAANVVQLTLDELPKIGAVIDAATQAGTNHVQGIQFTLRDQDAVRAQALREAALKARAEADVLAAALGLKVLRVLTVEENSPHVMPIRFDGAARTMVTSAVATTPVESGTLDVSAQVTLSVEVGAAGH